MSWMWTDAVCRSGRKGFTLLVKCLVLTGMFVSFFRLKTIEIFHWIDRQHFSCYFLCVDLVWPLLMCQTGSRVLGESRHRREKDADTLFMCLCDNFWSLGNTFKEKLDVWLWDWKMTYIRWKISNSIKRFSKKIKNKTYNKLLYYDFFLSFSLRTKSCS